MLNKRQKATYCKKTESPTVVYPPVVLDQCQTFTIFPTHLNYRYTHSLRKFCDQTSNVTIKNIDDIISDGFQRKCTSQILHFVAI
jgi:hypothetical protein